MNIPQQFPGCIQTFTGRMVDPQSAVESDIDIRDIAHALSNMCRFTGHCSRFESVAEHSVYVWSTVCDHFKADARTQLYALLHDASEAYLVDIPRPLKKLPEFQFYRVIENRLGSVIFNAFGLDPGAVPPCVKQADQIVLGLEARDLMGAKPGSCWTWCLDLVPPEIAKKNVRKSSFADNQQGSDFIVGMVEKLQKQIAAGA